MEDGNEVTEHGYKTIEELGVIENEITSNGTRNEHPILKSVVSSLKKTVVVGVMIAIPITFFNGGVHSILKPISEKIGMLASYIADKIEGGEPEVIENEIKHADMAEEIFIKELDSTDGKWDMYKLQDTKGSTVGWVYRQHIDGENEWVHVQDDRN